MQFIFVFVLSLMVFLTTISIYANTQGTNALNTHATEDYYRATIEKIMQPPPGALAILPCSMSEQQFAIAMLAKSHITELGKISLTTHSRNIGRAVNENNEWVDIYKGDFSNGGAIEYAFVINEEGTLHSQSIYIYKLIKNNFVKIDLDKIILNSFFPKISSNSCQGFIVDGCGLYNNLAEPFAMMLNGKTYLRYINYPFGDFAYRKDKLLLCTYLLQGNKLTLTGPNWQGSNGSDSNVIEASKNCIS